MTAARAFSGLAKNYGTTILLQHNGLPRSPYYAQRHLKGLFENLGVPSAISEQLANLRCRYSKKIQASLRGSGEYLPLEECHRRFGAELSIKLGEVLPEFGPFTTRFSYLYHEPSISNEVQQIVEHGTDRLIVMSLYPFEYPQLVEPMRKVTTSVLKGSFTKVQNSKSAKSIYVAKNRPVTFEFERLDAIGSHPSFVQYWSERLLNNVGNSDAIIFAVPMPSLLNQHKFFAQVHESVDQIMVKMHSRFPRAVSYRLAYYIPWSHTLPSYPLSKAVHKQISMLACFERSSPLIVPFGSFFKDFDTEYVLPTNYQDVRVLSPDERDGNLVHSFVELLKTRILTEKYESEKVYGLLADRSEMLRLDCCGLFCVLIVYFCMAYASYATMFWMILPTLNESLWGSIHIVAFNMLLFFAFLAHLRTMTSDPGIIPITKERQRTTKPKYYPQEDTSDDDSDIELFSTMKHYVGEDWTICVKCASYRPPRAHHCRVCRRCIAKLDHHCPWVNNCVGEMNQKFFLQFVFYVGILSVYAILIIVLSWIYHDENGSTGSHGPAGEIMRHYKVIHTVALSIECSLFGLFVLAVSCDQLQAIFNDETIIEALQRRTSLRRRQLQASKCSLLANVCGPKLHWSLWMVPCISSLPAKKEIVRFAKNLKDSNV